MILTWRIRTFRSTPVAQIIITWSTRDDFLCASTAHITFNIIIFFSLWIFNQLLLAVRTQEDGSLVGRYPHDWCVQISSDLLADWSICLTTLTNDKVIIIGDRSAHLPLVACLWGINDSAHCVAGPITVFHLGCQALMVMMIGVSWVTSLWMERMAWLTLTAAHVFYDHTRLE